MHPGDKVQFSVWRARKTLELTITLGERKANIVAEQEMEGNQPQAQSGKELGLALRSVEGGEEAQALGLSKPQGLVVVEVVAGSAASQVDIAKGDVVLEANQNPVNTVEQLKAVVKSSKANGLVLLLIKRHGRNMFRAIPLDKQ